MIFTGDIGTLLTFDLNSEILNSSTVKIRYRKPNGERGEWTGHVIDDSTVGYYTQEGDLDVSGKWRLQVYVETPVWKGSGKITQLTVSRRIEIQ